MNVIYLHPLIPGYAEEIHASGFFKTLFFSFLNLRRKPIPPEPNLIFLCFGFWQLLGSVGFLIPINDLYTKPAECTSFNQCT